MIYKIKVRTSKNRWVTFATTDEMFRCQFIMDALLNERSPDRFKRDEVRYEVEE